MPADPAEAAPRPAVRWQQRLVSLALAGLGLYLLSATQPWLTTVLELAPGAPRIRGTLAGHDLVPWGSAAALAGAVAAVVGLASTTRARTRWALLLLGWLGAATALVGLTSVVTALLLDEAQLADGGAARSLRIAGAPVQVISASSTGWLWMGGVAVLLATLALAGALVPGAPGASTSRHRPAASPASSGPGTGVSDPEEVERRRIAQAWRDLTDGEDPTGTE